MAEFEKAFLAYRHSGEDPAILEPMLAGVVKALGTAGVDTYCTFFSEEHFKSILMNPRGIMEHAFELIRQKDILLVVQASSKKSEGMLLEVGKYYGVKPIVVGTHSSVTDTYLPDMADSAFRWETQEELENGFLKALTTL